MKKDLIDLLKDTPISEKPSYALLKRIFEDQTICVEEQIVVKKGQEISANVSETANPDNDVQMITSGDVQPNTHSDRKFFEETLPQLKEEKE